MKVPRGAAEEKPPDTGENRVADVTILPHGMAPRTNSAEEAIAHDRVVAPSELLDERGQGREVVAVVGIAHDDVSAARREGRVEKRCSVAPDGIT